MLNDSIDQPMYVEGKACWLNHLDAALQKYDNRVHGTTTMTPFEMSTNQKPIPNKINHNDNKSSQIPGWRFCRSS